MRKIRFAGHDHEAGGHGSRPWVYFMIDCFFLITFFILVTFQFKRRENALEHTLPPGPVPGPVGRALGESIPVHVAKAGTTTAYSVHGAPMDLVQLEETLANAARNDADRYTVKITYDPATEWGDVMAVFNACTKVKLKSCGLVPLRSADAR